MSATGGIVSTRHHVKRDDQRIEQFVKQLFLRVEVAVCESADIEMLRDRDDAPILGALVAASADFLVTGDSDLLELSDRSPIETVAEFMRRI